MVFNSFRQVRIAEHCTSAVPLLYLATEDSDSKKAAWIPADAAPDALGTEATWIALLADFLWVPGERAGVTQIVNLDGISFEPIILLRTAISAY